jgi:hypothetical protein
VKAQAFLPAKDGDTSVFRITGLPRDQIWQIADNHVVPIRLQPVKGSAEIHAADALIHNLTVTLSEPPPQHANISIWPGGLSPDSAVRHPLMKKKQKENKSLNSSLKSPIGTQNNVTNQTEVDPRSRDHGITPLRISCNLLSFNL